MDLQATELPGQRVRVSWSPVPSATEYRITMRSTQGEADTARLSLRCRTAPLPCLFPRLGLYSFLLSPCPSTSQDGTEPRPDTESVCPRSAPACPFTWICLHSLSHIPDHGSHPSPQAQALPLPFYKLSCDHCPRRSLILWPLPISTPHPCLSMICCITVH